jgi:dihydroceramidase
MSSFWDPVTSTIDWCEENYAVTPYIAEFWNTISNLAYIILGLYGLHQSWNHEKRFKVTFLCLILVGVGSIFFHATLKWEGQLSDEIAMLMATLSTLYLLLSTKNIGSVRRYILIGGLFLIFVVFVIIYIFLQWALLFQVGWVSLVIVVVYRFMKLIQQMEIAVQRYYRIITIIFVLAAMMWLIEQLTCTSFPIVKLLKLHALFWHIGTAIGAYAVMIGCLYCRVKYLMGSISFYDFLPETIRDLSKEL